MLALCTGGEGHEWSWVAEDRKYKPFRFAFPISLGSLSTSLLIASFCFKEQSLSCVIEHYPGALGAKLNSFHQNAALDLA